MTERDRLIELMREAENKVQATLAKEFSLDLNEWLGIYADYLLTNGVKVEIPNNSVSMIDGHIEERKKAQWSINPDGYYPQCTNCWEEPKSRQMEKICPNCGAEMEGFSDYE